MGRTHSDVHFATDHLLNDIKTRMFSSGIATGLLQASLFVMNLGAVMVLARLLTPQDFGLLAMVLAVTGFFRVFNEAGLSTATIQREEITHPQVSNLFWVNIALGGAVTVLVASSAPVLGWYYHEPRVIAVTLVLSLTFILTSSTVQHLALLKRQMRFKALALIQMSSTAMGISVGITMAWFGFRYWSLVGMQLSTMVAGLLMAWSVSSWRPQIPTKQSGTWSLLTFGTNLTTGGLLWSLARGLDSLVIGRFFGSEALGLYSRGAALTYTPVDNAITPLEAIFVPVFSRLQAQPERYRRVFFQVYDLLAICGLPLAGMLFALAQPLTLAVLGPKWEDASPITAAFALYALYHPMVIIVAWLLSSQGRGKEFLLMSIFTSLVTILSFLVGLPFGPVGVAISFSLSCLVVQLPFIYWIAGREGVVTSRDLWIRFVRHFPLWGIVCATTWLMRTSVVDAAPITQLCVSAPVGVLAGVAFVWLYPPSRQAAINLLGVWQHWKKNPAIPI